jgi:DNA-binding CsgD family transcriptional regulator/predicted ester cyclase
MAKLKTEKKYSKTEQNNIATIKRFVEEVWNEKRFSTIPEIISPDFISHYEHGTIKGVDNYKEVFIKKIISAIPDIHVEVHEFFPHSDYVVYRWKAQGVHTGMLFGVPPTGNMVEINGMNWTKIVDGKWVENWKSWSLGHVVNKLIEQTKATKEANNALMVLLDQRERDKADIEQNIVASVNDMIIPYLGKLKNSSLAEYQLNLIAVIESNLDNLVQTFPKHLCSKAYCLTPMEIKVANLVHDGYANKEISEILGVAVSTILTHRHNLRDKMGLKNKKINLRRHLLSLS